MSHPPDPDWDVHVIAFITFWLIVLLVSFLTFVQFQQVG